MKKKTFALMFCIILTLAGCGNAVSENSDAVETPKVETTTEPKIAVTEASTADSIEQIQEKVEATEESTEEIIEEASAKTEASTEIQENETENTNEAASAEPVSNEKVEETAEPSYSTIIEKYIADGDFSDYKEYGLEMGANDVRITANEICIDFYFDNFDVGLRTNEQNTDEYTYVAIGTIDKRFIYACDILFPGKPAVPVSTSGASVSIDSLMILEQTINYMKQHPDPNQIPDIPGTTWVVW